MIPFLGCELTPLQAQVLFYLLVIAIIVTGLLIREVWK
jgi:hypothetical protein